jgi:hypothetical protein
VDVAGKSTHDLHDHMKTCTAVSVKVKTWARLFAHDKPPTVNNIDQVWATLCERVHHAISPLPGGVMLVPDNLSPPETRFLVRLYISRKYTVEMVGMGGQRRSPREEEINTPPGSPVPGSKKRKGAPKDKLSDDGACSKKKSKKSKKDETVSRDGAGIAKKKSKKKSKKHSRD